MKGKTGVSMLEELKKCEAENNLKKTKRASIKTRNQTKAIQEAESTSEQDEDNEEIE